MCNSKKHSVNCCTRDKLLLRVRLMACKMNALPHTHKKNTLAHFSYPLSHRSLRQINTQRILVLGSDKYLYICLRFLFFYVEGGRNHQSIDVPFIFVLNHPLQITGLPTFKILNRCLSVLLLPSKEPVLINWWKLWCLKICSIYLDRYTSPLFYKFLLQVSHF